MKGLCLVLFLIPLAAAADVEERQPLELRQVLALPAQSTEKIAALTLDACAGGVDRDIIDFLIERRIPATIFVTRRWLRRNSGAVAALRDHADLFDVENHGANHLPAVIGTQRTVYGLAGVADLAAVKREVAQGAAAVKAATGTAPRWYRGATGLYDPEALEAIEAMGYKIAGFSVNADNGARLSKERVVARLKKVRNGDIIVAHVNKPESATGEGLPTGLLYLIDQGFRFVALRDMEVKPAR